MTDVYTQPYQYHTQIPNKKARRTLQDVEIPEDVNKSTKVALKSAVKRYGSIRTSTKDIRVAQSVNLDDRKDQMKRYADQVKFE
jgi:hypothetical protein|tara:strand:+ start:359 stop:610 length:252 start_codon:yes stop_codon:yes gene_type:complete